MQCQIEFPNIGSSQSFEVVTSGGTWLKARGREVRNPFTHREVQQATNVQLQYSGKLPWVISGLHYEVDENCALLGYYAASSGNSLRSFGTKYRSHLQGSIFFMRPIGFPKISLRYYHYSLRNDPEERSSQAGYCLFLSFLRWFPHSVFSGT
jgi:hypothetical protein